MERLHDHYPFGSLLPGRNFSSSSYRFGFQGQEKDDEINGATGTSYAFEYRIHDPRIGRFLSIDPLAAKYPYWSPYTFSGNRVIDMIELEGLEPTTPVGTWNVWQNLGDKYGTGGTVLLVSDAGSDVTWEVVRYQSEAMGIDWTYKDPNKAAGSRWSLNWSPSGPNEPVPAAQFGLPIQDTDPYVKPGTCYGCAFSDAMSKGMLHGALTLTTMGFGSGASLGLSYFRAKTVDAGLELGADYVANNFNFSKVDLLDVGFQYAPVGAREVLSANFDLNAMGEFSSTLSSGDSRKGIGSVAIELGFGFGGEYVSSMSKRFSLLTGTGTQYGNPMLEVPGTSLLKMAETGAKGDNQ